MKKIVHALLALSLFFASTAISHAQKDKNKKGFMFTTSSNEALSFFNQGVKYYDCGETTKARQELEKAIQQDPSFSIAYVYLANLSASPQEFVSNLDKAKEHLSGTNDWEKLLYDYTETFLSDNADKRLEVAQKMTTQFPNNARACVFLGQAYDSRNDFINARKCYQKAVSLEPDWTGGYVALANSFLFEDPKDFNQAEKTANKLASIAPSNATYILLGDTYRAQNNLDKAGEMYSKAISMDDQIPDAYYKKGHVCSYTGKFDEARTNYEKAGTLDVIPSQARQDIAFTYLYQGDPTKALESLHNDINNISPTIDATKVSQFKLDLSMVCAYIAFHTGDAKTLEEVIKMTEPLTEDVGNRIGTTEIKNEFKADMLHWNGLLKALNNDFAGAKQNADEIKTTLESINNPLKLDGYHFLLGYVAYQQKDFSTAIDHFEKTNQLDVYNQYWLAKAYQAAGKKDKADAIYKYLSNYNFNNTGYALVRNELKKKM